MVMCAMKNVMVMFLTVILIPIGTMVIVMMLFMWVHVALRSLFHLRFVCQRTRIVLNYRLFVVGFHVAGFLLLHIPRRLRLKGREVASDAIV